jgi:NADH dehydrogenase [ubiquinone] 1 alpha subcomplex assembly factor 7
VVNQFPASRSALNSVHLIENSHALQAIQEEKLLPASMVGRWDLLWHDSLDDVPQETEEYTMLVAHEFFDALPIHVLEVSF